MTMRPTKRARKPSRRATARRAAANSRSPICCAFIKTSGVTNTVWLTADVHYAAAHYYNPDKAQFQDFEPFWEFVSGPLHAGTFGPNELDNTFGPEVKFIKAPGLDKQNLPPSAGMQFFGHVKIDGVSGQMTLTLRDRADVALWSKTLDPKPG